MVEIQWIVNEQTKERRLYYRTLLIYSPTRRGILAIGEYGPWKRVPVLTLDESSLQDLVESGGIIDIKV